MYGRITLDAYSAFFRCDTCATHGIRFDIDLVPEVFTLKCSTCNSIVRQGTTKMTFLYRAAIPERKRYYEGDEISSDELEQLQKFNRSKVSR